MAKEVKKQEIPQEVLKYLQSLMVEKGLDNMPGNIQGDMLYDLYVNYNNFLMVNFLAKMNQSTRNKFNGLLEKDPKSVELEKFLKENLDYEKVVKETSEEFRSTFLGLKD